MISKPANPLKPPYGGFFLVYEVIPYPLPAPPYFII